MHVHVDTHTHMTVIVVGVSCMYSSRQDVTCLHHCKHLTVDFWLMETELCIICNLACFEIMIVWHQDAPALFLVQQIIITCTCTTYSIAMSPHTGTIAILAVALLWLLAPPNRFVQPHLMNIISKYYPRFHCSNCSEGSHWERTASWQITMALASLLQGGQLKKSVEVPAHVRDKYEIEKELARWAIPVAELKYTVSTGYCVS